MALIVSWRRILLEAKSKDKGLYWGLRIGRVIPHCKRSGNGIPFNPEKGILTVNPERNHEAIQREDIHMLWTLAMVLTVLWLLGLVSSYTMGGLIHILLVIAVVVVLVRIIQGRRPI